MAGDVIFYIGGGGYIKKGPFLHVNKWEVVEATKAEI